MGQTSTSNSILQSPSILTVVDLIFSIMGEELIKLIPLLFLMKIAYKISNNRKISIIIPMLIVMILFGALHVVEYNNLLISVVIIGFGSIFEMFAYLKTKNLWISYLTHLLTDLILLGLAIAGL